MKKEIWLIIILAIVIVILAGVFLWSENNINTGQKFPVGDGGITITSAQRTDSNFADIKINGYVSDNSWSPFEGQAGIVKFLDKDDKELGYSFLTVIGEWMAPMPINFEAFTRMTSQEADAIVKLLFVNENPSGDPSRAKTFILPIKIK